MSGKSKFELVAPLSPDALTERCRSEGIRMGRVRTAVARAVAETDGHFDFDCVLAGARRTVPQISRGTIYLSLRRFVLAELSAHRGACEFVTLTVRGSARNPPAPNSPIQCRTAPPSQS